ncbi:undecaprenyl-diphosphatase [Candidatus Woesearchaeota archaeon CG08_land_8_20_14_0_20_43_7]|nr:MAG: undecaprenyl-diphosphatase [Candidatus Woesearchaeota archaeon CG08_land_8_20_14_0_20_43_7]
MLTLIKAIILGIIQGITEWLPVSSSGHLVIFQRMLGLSVPVFFDILLHIGTLIAVVAVFHKDIMDMIKAVFTFRFQTVPGKLAIFIIIGSIPTAIIGFAFHDLFSSFFNSLLVVGIALIVTGIFLSVCERKEGKRSLDTKNAFLIGIAQGVAIIPGISRSGSTIGTALLLGIKKETAARYSFLLAIPAIIGAGIFEGKEIIFSSMDWLPVIAGVLTSAIIGYLCIKLLLRLIAKRKFHLFSIYCILVGVISIILHYAGF